MPLTKNLSNSKLLSFRQCPKRFWLEVHQPELKQDSPPTQAIFAIGHTVGGIAKTLYDPHCEGISIDSTTIGEAEALQQTQQALSAGKPIFEAAFAHGGALAFTDVLLPTSEGSWHMIEVKSSTDIKPYQVEDVAIQSYIAKGSGLDLHSVSIAHVDKTWIYPGQGDYSGLLVKKDLTAQTLARHIDAARWIAAAQSVAAQAKSPKTVMGKQCSAPYACPFAEHCAKDLPKAEFPVAWLPRMQSKKLIQHLEDNNITDMRHVPSDLLTPEQRRVTHVTMHGRTYFDGEEAARALSAYPLPAYFLDFETIQHGVPRWAGTHPYQCIPFQFSLHTMAEDGTLTHTAFLDISGDDPLEPFTAALLEACAEPFPIFVYNAGFEKTCIKELAERFEPVRESLLELRERVVDLLPIIKQYYYHKAQYGSWNLKKVLPCMAPQSNYAALSGVQDGSLAMQAYAEAISTDTSAERKAEIEQQLLEYCALDTQAMVEIWKFLTGAPRA